MMPATPSDPGESAWRDPESWRAGGFYVAPDDARVWVPKRPPGIGWTLNFARRASWVWMAVLLAIPIGTMVFAFRLVLGAAAARGR